MVLLILRRLPPTRLVFCNTSLPGLNPDKSTVLITALIARGFARAGGRPAALAASKTAGWLATFCSIAFISSGVVGICLRPVAFAIALKASGVRTSLALPIAAVAAKACGIAGTAGIPGIAGIPGTCGIP